MCLGILSWALVVAGTVFALVAVGCGAASLLTRDGHRIDGLAVVGTILGAGHLLASVMLLVWALR